MSDKIPSVEDVIIHQIMNTELEKAEENKEYADSDFRSFVDLLDIFRSDKDYDWHSDIRIPQFASQMLTQSSLDADLYFASRDFVEVYLEDDNNEALKNAEASKELINKTLNSRYLHYYLKYMRAKNLNHLNGNCYAACWWEKKTVNRQVGVKKKISPKTIEGEEEVIESEIIEEPIYEDIAVLDRFNFDLIDPRDVYISPEYTYSLQEKRWITIKDVKTFSELKEDASRYNYKNLNKLNEISQESNVLEKDKDWDRHKTIEHTPIDKSFKLYTRFGKFWAIVNETNPDGHPTKISYGVDSDNNKLDGAELVEAIIVIASNGNSEYIIRFDPSPFLDAFGLPYKPIIRGLCYVHPTEDVGMGDGRFGKDLQKAIDDSFNLGNDRAMLSTLPTFIGNKHALEDNSTFYFEPEHVIEVDDINTDLKELKIDSDIGATNNQLALLTEKMNQVMAVYPSTMGSLPSKSSTTATAIVGAENKANIRANYKNYTFEYTFLTELYWMIQQMTYQFAEPETGLKLMGEKVYNFDPTKEYWYKPVSQSIETEYSKQSKLRLWLQALGYIGSLGHPDTPKLVNYIMTQVFLLLGDEFANFAKNLLDVNKAIEQKRGGGGVEREEEVVSNQAGIPQSGMEQEAREGIE